MDELMQKLQSVLSDEESMNQIRSLASMFSNGESNNSSNNQQSQPPGPNNNQGETEESKGQPEVNINDISKLLASISGEGSQLNNNPSEQNNQNILSGLLDSSNQNQQDLNQMPFDLSKMMALGNVILNASKPDKNTELLLALKPHLKEEKQGKVDKVIKIFKLISIWPAIKDSGLLGGDLFGIL